MSDTLTHTGTNAPEAGALFLAENSDADIIVNPFETLSWQRLRYHRALGNCMLDGVSHTLPPEFEPETPTLMWLKRDESPSGEPIFTWDTVEHTDNFNAARKRWRFSLTPRGLLAAFRQYDGQGRVNGAERDFWQPDMETVEASPAMLAGINHIAMADLGTIAELAQARWEKGGIAYEELLANPPGATETKTETICDYREIPRCDQPIDALRNGELIEVERTSTITLSPEKAAENHERALEAAIKKQHLPQTAPAKLHFLSV